MSNEGKKHILQCCLPIHYSGEPLSMSYFKMSTASESDSPTKENDSDKDDNLDVEVGPLANVHYSVFGLGSRAYPNFCAFAHFVDNMMHALDGMRITKLVEGDELCGQEESFRQWAQEAFKVSIPFALACLKWFIFVNVQDLRHIGACWENRHIFVYLRVIKVCACRFVLFIVVLHRCCIPSLLIVYGV